VMADPDWCRGDYHSEDKRPMKGLAVARMAAHITYLSDEALHRKFGRRLQDREALTFGFDADFQVESYLRHQGMTFVERFDANSYLYLTRAMDYFDLAADFGGSLANAFMGTKTRFCIVSFTSDWLFPTEGNRQIVHALNAAGARVSFVEVETDRGHDAFLLDEPDMEAALRGFLHSAARARGLDASDQDANQDADQDAGRSSQS
jgi:homoserine O-acetyltransferase